MRYLSIPAALGSAALLAACIPATPTPQQDYAELCAACHGATGRGDGPLADSLPTPPADLTQLAATNGGEFPLVRVMSQIDGYSRSKEDGGPMPEFGRLLEGNLVMVDTGDGVDTPTPERLAALAEYLRTLQSP